MLEEILTVGEGLLGGEFVQGESNSFSTQMISEHRAC
jgi:hypothetical protein